MKGNSILLVFFFVSLFLAESISAAQSGDVNANGVYIVYMGAADSGNGSLRNDHSQILSTVLKRNENALVRNYKYGFSGFAARLSKEEAQLIAKNPGVVSVFPDPVLKLHTTRSWEFLKYQTDVKIDDSDSNANGDDTIIGILDTGIWPESASFGDKGTSPVPSRWKGTCMKAKDFSSSNCNRKLIGARYYSDDAFGTPRDTVGHGTHVASTAAGSTVADASYYGLAEGIAKGGSPGSRVAMYKVCAQFGCRGSAILAAFDDAIADGVDVLSLSLGAPAEGRPELTSDPIAIGAFHAVEHGITVVCSAGNDGPNSNAVANDAPWLLTVAATTIDRDFESNVVLGGNKKAIIKGEGINFSPLSKSPTYSLVYGESAKADNAKLVEARNCYPGALDENKIKGKIVLCEGNDDEFSTSDKIDVVKEAQGVGVISINDQTRAVASVYRTFPATVISSKDATTVLQYVNSTNNPVATILETESVSNYKPAPMVAYFSSRGPSTLSRNILKPDIAAPGVNILAAWTGNDTDEAPSGKEPPQFNVISGTSMACPHVSGVAAAVKSRNPTWSPSAIKSAIITTATQKNNLKAPITTDSGLVATPYDYGAGELTTAGPLQPGLVYETTTADYLNYLCFLGLSVTDIKVISKTVSDGFTCPKDSNAGMISNINYPSIAISNFNANEIKNVTRTVTNVGGDDQTVYSSVVEAPSGVNVKVTPAKLQFTKSSKKLSYQVVFSLTSTSLEQDVFGSISWTNGKFTVRSPFVLSKR
ncbi:hypothetical protein L6164_024888 [Bauhinia variegata]|uniref:Uncharacterized protein n=1 Tax=Bauhinia variegata TaxID=167791 RepID=A0ACB9LZ80_BAUVA|nr:hypothetical protein L6164_024888 [Bauhinia variegata]